MYVRAVPSADDELRALGRYFHVFSRLIQMMRFQLARMSTAKVPEEYRLGEVFQALTLHTGDMNFDHLANVYFAVAELIGNYTEPELKMAKKMRSELSGFIETRNDFAHGEWQIGWFGSRPTTSGLEQMTGVELLPATLRRTKARRSGEKTSSTEYTAREIDTLSEKLVRLGCWVIDWGKLVEGNGFVVGTPSGNDWRVARPEEVYVLRGGTLTRTGPVAGLVPLFQYVGP